MLTVQESDLVRDLVIVARALCAGNNDQDLTSLESRHFQNPRSLLKALNQLVNTFNSNICVYGDPADSPSVPGNGDGVYATVNEYGVERVFYLSTKTLTYCPDPRRTDSDRRLLERIRNSVPDEVLLKWTQEAR